MLELKSTFQSLPCIFIVHIKKNTGELEDVNFVYSCHSNVKFISPRHRVTSSMYVFPFHLTLLRGSGGGSRLEFRLGGRVLYSILTKILMLNKSV